MAYQGLPYSLAFSLPAGPGAPPEPIAPIHFGLPPAFAALIQAQQAQYGGDVSCLTDLDPGLTLVQNALPQDVWHYVTEAQGAIFWAPVQTFSMLNLLSKGTTVATTSQIQSALKSVLLGDERVASCQVTVVLDVDTMTYEITIQVVPHQGQAFQFVAAVSKASVTLLSAGLIS